MRLFIFICVILIAEGKLCAQSPAFFETTYGSENPDFSRGIVQLSDSSVFVAGYVQYPATSKSDYTLHRLDASGNLIWSKYFGDSLLSENAQGMLLSYNGNLILWGDQETGAGPFNGLVAELDTSGMLLNGITVVPGSGNLSLHAGAQLLDSTYVFVGYQSAGNHNEIVIVHCDQQLNIIQQFSETSSYNAYAQGVVAFPDTGFVVVADQSNGSDYDVWVGRYDKHGVNMWGNMYGDTLQNGSQGIIVTSDGNLAVFGETEIFNFSLFDFFIQKIDSNGNSMWRTTSGGANSDAAFSVLEVWNGFIGTGYSNSFEAGPISAVVFRTDTVGNLLWAHQYGGPTIDLGYQIIPSLDNGFYITGNSEVGSDVQCYLLHTDQAGWLNVPDVSEEADGVGVFPNPSQGDFMFYSHGEEIEKVEIYSLTGELIFSESCFGNVCNIALDIPNGMYIYRVSTFKNVAGGKIVLSR